MFNPSLRKFFIIVFIFIMDNAYADRLEDYTHYCIASGGQREEMAADVGTSKGKLIKGYTQSFCNFKLKDGFVAVGLETFSSNTPSIAATYIKKLKEIEQDSKLLEGTYSNPSLNVCKNLGGASIAFLLNGGFANELGQTDICVFGDGSMVSGWSLIYMANHEDGYELVKSKVKADPLDFILHSY